jgi:hypothetical protein
VLQLVVKLAVGDIADECWTGEQAPQSLNRKRLGAVRDRQDAVGLEQADEPCHEVVAADNDRQRFRGDSTDDGSW